MTMLQNDDAPGEPGASRDCTDVDDQPSVRVRPKRLISGLIRWKYVTGEATLQLLLLPAGSEPPEVTPWAWPELD